MKKSSRANWHRWMCWSVVAVFGLPLATVWSTASAQQSACVGDCQSNNSVTVDDILTMLNIALGGGEITACENGDANGDGKITIEDIVVAINNAKLSDISQCVRVPGGQGRCGDGHMDPGEDCDNGGTCTGGAMSGTHCTSDADCGGSAQPGVCLGGPMMDVACMGDTDCPSSSCVRCKTFGGMGCAANCTTETDVPYMLQPGVVTGSSIEPGTSGATVFGEIIPMLPLPLTGSQVLTIGKAKDGKIPLVIKAPSVQFPQIPVSNIACACVRGFEAMTCGGVLFEVGGTAQSPVCNDLAVPYDCTANGKAPCSTVHGTGNSASGEIGCQGLDAVNVDLQQDCNGEAGGMPFPPVVTISGAGGNGSAIVLNSIQIGTQVGACTANFCTDADPPEARGMPQTLPYTTGMATATVHNANDVPGFDIGPQSEMGSPFTCQGDGIGSVAGVSIAGAFTACDQPTIADIVVTNTLVGASQ
jgi:hypothetical protein